MGAYDLCSPYQMVHLGKVVKVSVESVTGYGGDGEYCNTIALTWNGEKYNMLFFNEKTAFEFADALKAGEGKLKCEWEGKQVDLVVISRTFEGEDYTIVEFGDGIGNGKGLVFLSKIRYDLAATIKEGNEFRVKTIKRDQSMKLVRIEQTQEWDQCLVFDNGKTLGYYHDQECCETVYADFMGMQVMGPQPTNYIDSENLDFFPNILDSVVPIDGLGFYLVTKQGTCILVPCYNRQNGYYGSDLTLVYGDERKDISECVKDDIE